VRTYFEVQADPSIGRRLRYITEMQEREMLLAMLRAGAKPIKDAAVQNAPTGKRTYVRKSKKYGVVTVTPGNLKAAISVVMRKDKTTGDPLVLVRVKQGPKEAHDAWYGRFVEWGTSRMGARPFMRPALVEKADEAINAAAAAGTLWIEQKVGRA
jgi:HK97 gp10 family phage protein